MKNENTTKLPEAKNKQKGSGGRPSTPCSRSSLIERLHETPKTDDLASEIKRNNWQDWHNLEKMEEHAKKLERSENKLKHRIKQLLKHRGHVAAETLMDKMASEISSENH